MRNFHQTEVLDASLAQTLIFDGCRANASRESYVSTLRQGFTVEFVPSSSSEHLALLRDPTGLLLATAIVDEFDV